MMKQFHPFHMVFMSPWPVLCGILVFSLLVTNTAIFNKHNYTLIYFCTLSLFMTLYQWWRDVSRESSMQGFHTNFVQGGMRWGMILFIVSEILFFFSFFWSFFHNSLAPNFEMGILWPPMGLNTINPFQVPILNTTILLSSGIAVTLSHHFLINNNNKKMQRTMMMTVILGVYFTILQTWEYLEASYSMSDSSYGSTFFLATGFHGIHVIVGTLFLYFSLLRFNTNIMSNNHHFGLEASIWYWHFVDVVWLFLYSFIYWWSY